MKKIIIALFTFFPVFAYGENMCVKDGSIMVILDPQINGTELSYEVDHKTWSVQFSYGVVSGIGGCYANVGATAGVVATNQAITSYTSGPTCYCKMLRPVESMWVFSNYNTVYYDATCAGDCARFCSKYVASNVAVRSGLFGNIVQ